ncbi:RNA binding domain-containing protein [Boeremia exigua]|uniref:RNA binding domain-containing protein n=1 Tax=Boeremia exigua TaxID=749465 RepID=UPI001E8D660A|nr:RNA binding domain-containing protein [Boeremia exigua]KAH6637899.1 RNA binding domain-containing protein [Boeremia exigua]
MYLLRRSAVRAISATPSKAFLTAPRSISTFTPAFRTQQKWTVSAFQRRFASDDVVTKEEVAAEAPEDFAQTIAEPITEDGLTPVQQDAQAEPTNAEKTIGIDALQAAANSADKPQRGQRREQSQAPPNNTVYVGNLYYEVTADQVKRVFSRFGEIENVKLVFDNRGLSRGFGYVEFKNIEDAKTAIENLDMQVFEGRNLVCQFHKAKTNSKTFSAGAYQPNAPTKTLFIGNMSFEMSDKDLNDLFRDIRNVVDVRVAIDRRTGQPRGFAHADFIDVASATAAKEILKEKTIYGRQLRIDFSKSSESRPSRNDSAQGRDRE